MSQPSGEGEREPLTRSSGVHSHFGVTNEALRKLVDERSNDVLKELGGVKGVARALRVDPEVGLSQDEGTGDGGKRFNERRAVFGKNVLPEADHHSFWSYLFEAIQDRILIMLSIGAIISLTIGIYEDYSPNHPKDEPRVGWIEGTAILAAVLVVILTNAINDYQKEKQFRKLNSKKEDRAVTVVRDGREIKISVYDINVGDILKLEPGDIVPVDGIYLDGHNLKCDESSTTGESDARSKNRPEEDDGDCFILSGSKILEGVGTVLTIAVGTNSSSGRTMMSMRGNDNQETPLQEKLDRLAEQIAKLGISAALLMLIVLTVKLFIAAAMKPKFPPIDVLVSSVVAIVIQAITILVVAVPEGLPMAVTLALAYATTQMLKDNNLVRVLSACETMGSVTTICSDKTGTLTQNQMTVVEAVLGEKRLKVGEGESNDAWKQKLSKDTYDIFCESVATDSTAFEGKDDKGNPTFVGSKTESALLEQIKQLGEDYKEMRHSAKQVKIYPFSSKSKTMSVVVHTHAGSGGRDSSHGSSQKLRLYVKGASEIVIRHCTHYISADGNIKKMDDTPRKQFEEIISEYANRALRTIGIAYRDVTDREVESFGEEPSLEKLVCIGIVGIQDPLRECVVKSVRTCRRAGVYVKMITGDNIQTAKAIAKNAGILTKGGVVMDGEEFRNLSESEQAEALPRLQVLARSSPIDKQIVVKTLQKLGEVVAVTGDGTNDAPALKMADIGFSMGITGTEVAKEASEIVLMDDNFNSIVAAIRWGRAVNDSVRKFLTFQLTVNICAVVLAFVSAVIDPNNQSILSATQLLWVNLIMDTLAALALATERPSEELLKRRPLARGAPLINVNMWKMIIGQALFQIVITILLLYLGASIFHLGKSSHDIAMKQTIIFNTFVFLQVFNEINCRRIDDNLNIFRGIMTNYTFLLVQFFVIGGQYLIVTFGGVAFKTVPLPWQYWLATVAIGALSLPIGILLRLLPDGGLADRLPQQEHRPLVSQEQMRWQSAIGDVKNKLRVYKAIRRVPKRSRSKRQADSDSDE